MREISISVHQLIFNSAVELGLINSDEDVEIVMEHDGNEIDILNKYVIVRVYSEEDNQS